MNILNPSLTNFQMSLKKTTGLTRHSNLYETFLDCHIKGAIKESKEKY